METTTPPKRRRGRPRKTAKVEETKPAEESKVEATEQPKAEEKKEQPDFPTVDEREVGIDPLASQPSTEGGLPSVDDFNPLSEAVEQRDYSSPKIATGVTEEIAEPTFHQPSYQELNGEQNAEEKGGGVWNPIEEGNPALEELPDKEKSAAVKTMVNAVLDMYDGAHIIAQRAVQMPEEKLAEMHRDGKINMHQRIPVGAGGQDMNVVELTQTFNQQAAEALEPSEEFRNKVTPPMTRIFMKRGWGMTDEQALLLYFGQDIASKAILVYSLKSQMNQIIKLVSTDESVAQKASSKREQEELANEAEEIANEEDAMRSGSVSDDIEDVADDDGMVSQKMSINNEENPLRVDTRREPKAPKVQSKFVKGAKP
jgi:hypothetical protein